MKSLKKQSKNNLKTNKKKGVKKKQKRNYSENLNFKKEYPKNSRYLTDSDILRRWIKEISEKKKVVHTLSDTQIQFACKMLNIKCNLESKRNQLISIARHVLKKSSNQELVSFTNIKETGSWIVKIINQSMNHQLRKRRNSNQIGGGLQKSTDYQRTLCIKRIYQMRRRAKRNNVRHKYRLKNIKPGN